MAYFRPYIFVFLAITTFLACNNNGDQKSSGSDSTISGGDTTNVPADSLVYEDCYEKFFAGLPSLTDSNTIITLKNGNKVKFSEFKTTDLDSKYMRIGLKSIDGDTIPELITYNNTGGAHCCDVISIFARDKAGYTFKAGLYGGFACIDPVTNVFTYSLNETLGYFFTCYACGFSDSAKGYQTIRELEFSYAKGRFNLNPVSDSTAKQLIKNLEILRDHGYEELPADGNMDSGWRKEFVMNFAIWHYQHGKKWDETKKLFDQYYRFKDAAKVWKEFYSTLKDGEKESSI